MGIRFDRDSRRTTDGSVTFFSLIKDETFREEITNAYLSGLSFYAYRYPGDNMLSFGVSEGIVQGIGEPGFVIGMFSPTLPYFTIPFKNIKNTYTSGSLYTMPDYSTECGEFDNEVREIIKKIEEGEGNKVVAALVEVREDKMDIADKFYDLCQRCPDAYVFCFSTPATGCWIGASPELLLETKNKILNTMSLAGSRSYRMINDWSEKDKCEQKIVTDYIADILTKHGLEPVFGETYTREAGTMEHICTPISVNLEKSSLLTVEKLERLLRDLSPTPAVCGNPKDFALKMINKYENFERGCYGGFCGPFHSVEDFTFNVVLRCASVNEEKYCVYAGAGIVLKSIESAEWFEIIGKIETVFENIKSY